MLELSEKRQEILDASGNLLIMGGPGSGKTTIALLKADSEIHKGVLKRGQKILFLSFARATISRVESHAKDILVAHDTSSVEITTYHSFIWTILKSHGYLLVPHKIRLLLPHDASPRLSLFASKEEREVEKRRLFQDEGLLHFDLFAQNCTALLAHSNTLSEIFAAAYPIIILDEFQDTNQDEWELIMHLGKRSTLIALADPEQRIYDFRGADPARVRQFIEAFHPAEFDFGTENNRSNGTDIVKFGNDLLAGRNKGKNYNDVEICQYPPRKGDSQLYSLKSLVLQRLNSAGANSDWSLAVLVPSNRMMMSVSDVLGKRNTFKKGGFLPAIPHDVSLDVMGSAIAVVVIAGLLEQSSQGICTVERFVLPLCDHILGRGGDKGASQSNQNDVKAILEYVATGNYDKPMLAKSRQSILDDCKQIVCRCNALHFSGDVTADWITIRDTLKESTCKCLKNLHEDAMFIKLLNKGSLLNSSLAQLWRANGSYFGATEAVKTALAQEHFATSTKTWSGVNVLTIHKSKGKEFDEVIVYEGAFDGHRIVHGCDYDRAKLNLRVAITRAKSKAIIMTPTNDPCPLI